MNFIKKNIIFTIVMFITLLGALYLIYLDWTNHDAISEANETTRQNQEKFDEAFKKGNKPVDLNIKMIKDDTDELRKRTVRLQRIFGNPYRKALLKFAAGLKVTEDELYERMKKLYEDDNEKVKKAEVLIPKLFEGLEKDKKLSSADVMNEYKKFISDVQMETVEDFPSLTAGYDILGDALGLPRTMSPSIAHVYLGQMQRKLLSQRLIPGVTRLDMVQNFTFNQFIQTFPSTSDVDDILNTMPIYEDIFRRMNACRLETVESFERTGRPIKIAGDKYLAYDFSTTVVGTIDSVRNFMNNLLDAYKENRVYVITWVALTSPASSAEVEAVRKNLLGEEQHSAPQGEEFGPENRPGTRRRGGSLRRPPRPGSPQRRRSLQIRQPLSELEAEMQPDYGSVLIGKDRNIRAVLRFRYYRYVGERLKK